MLQHRNKQPIKRYIELSDTAFLDIPVERSILEWWMECQELDPYASCEPSFSTFFDENGPDHRIQEVYFMLCDLRAEVYEWCDTVLTAAPELVTSMFTICEDDCMKPPLDVVKSHCGTNIRLKFVTDKDLVHFKLRWF